MTQTDSPRDFIQKELTGLIEPLADMIASADNPCLMRALVIDKIGEQVVGIDRDATFFIQAKLSTPCQICGSLSVHGACFHDSVTY